MKTPIQSFFIRSAGEVLQIVASTCDKDALSALGFGCTVEEAGEAGKHQDSDLATYADHEIAIRAGKKLDKRGSLDTVKAKALEAIKDGDDSSTTD